MTPQEIFDTVSRHLIRQGHPAIGVTPNGDFNPSCVYRGPHGDKCAFGILIPDSCYVPQMEGNNCRALFDDYQCVVDAVGTFESVGPLCIKLQHAHDNGGLGFEDIPSLKDALRQIARDYTLNPSVLDE